MLMYVAMVIRLQKYTKSEEINGFLLLDILYEEWLE